MESTTITQLFIYPIKSLAGISLSSTSISPLGLEHDRNWMLIDDSGRFLSQRELPVLSQFSVKLHPTGLLVEYNQSQVIIPFAPTTTHTVSTAIWDDQVEAQSYDNEINNWFSDNLNQHCRLVKYAQPISHRQIDPKYAKQGETTAFSDGYPVLIVSEASLENLNSKLEYSIGIERFRPNIVVNNLMPHAEDDLREFSVNAVNMLGAKPCGRCIVTTIDPETGKTGQEPLRTLATYRKKDNKILFGNNVLVRGSGTISIGDRIILH